MTRWLISYSIFLIMLSPLFGQHLLKVGLFDNVQNCKVSVLSSSILELDSIKKITLKDSCHLMIHDESGELKITIDGGKSYKADKIRILNTEEDRPFVLECKGRKRKYPSHLLFLKQARGYNVIQETDVDTYLQGVIQAEMGYRLSLNSYKAQTICARTYSYANLKRHESQGYNICNEQHCQVYIGTDSVPPTVKKAIKETHNMVLIEPSGKLVNAVFHANCGGYTANSEDVWLTRKSCLRAKKDPYCSKGKGFKWTKEFSVKEFSRILTPYSKSKQIKFDPKEPIKVTCTNRKQNFVWKDVSVSYATLRSLLGCRTSLFSVQQKGDKISIDGRGFGHGVGLCQEGAIEMGKREMSYKKILSHYYQGSKIIEKNLSQIKAKDLDEDEQD